MARPIAPHGVPPRAPPARRSDRLYNDKGEVAVIYSPGYGAGWSSWDYGNDFGDAPVFDPELAQAILDGAGRERLETIAARKWDGLYQGGLRDVQVEWLAEGTVFVIREYDGSESIEVLSEIKAHVA
jgi:hypothetical protein